MGLQDEEHVGLGRESQAGRIEQTQIVGIKGPNLPNVADTALSQAAGAQGRWQQPTEPDHYDEQEP